MRLDLDLCDLIFATVSATFGCIRGYSLPNRTANAYRQIRTIRTMARGESVKFKCHSVVV